MRDLGQDEWQGERQRFQDRIAMLERLLDTANAAGAEKLDHYKDVERKLEGAIQSKAQLQLDLERAVSELNSKLQTAAETARDHAAHGEQLALPHRVVHFPAHRVRMPA